MFLLSMLNKLLTIIMITRPLTIFGKFSILDDYGVLATILVVVFNEKLEIQESRSVDGQHEQTQL